MLFSRLFPRYTCVFRFSYLLLFRFRRWLSGTRQLRRDLAGSGDVFISVFSTLDGTPAAPITQQACIPAMRNYLLSAWHSCCIAFLHALRNARRKPACNNGAGRAEPQSKAPRPPVRRGNCPCPPKTFHCLSIVFL